MFNSRRRQAALLALVAAIVLLLGYHWHHERWLVLLGTCTGATCLVLAIDRHNLLWDGLCVSSLFVAGLRSWMEGRSLWTVFYTATVAFGLVQIFRKIQFRAQREDAQHWPLTKGEWGQNYATEDGQTIYYAYQVNGNYFPGAFTAGPTLSKRLKSRLDDLKGKPAVVRYKPQRPEISKIIKSDQTELSI